MAQAGNADDGDRVAVSKDALDGIERLIRVTQSMTETMSKINGSMERILDDKEEVKELKESLTTHQQMPAAKKKKRKKKKKGNNESENQ